MVTNYLNCRSLFPLMFLTSVWCKFHSIFAVIKKQILKINQRQSTLIKIRSINDTPYYANRLKIRPKRCNSINYLFQPFCFQTLTKGECSEGRLRKSRFITIFFSFLLASASTPSFCIVVNSIPKNLLVLSKITFLFLL